jgi:geranylgeranyl diphosphate synthase type I
VNLPAIFECYRSDIESALRSALPASDLAMGHMLCYHMGWVDQIGRSAQGNSGKALRPTLCLFACQATSGDYHPALPAAAAIELVHNFSLIHDDIQDGDKERRHQPTLWWLWGKPQAIQAGVAMRIMASLTLSRPANGAAPPSRLLRANQLLDERCLEMIEGQYLDISYENRLDITVDAYLDMISKKTGALIGCSLELGALLGGADDALTSRFHSCGCKLGLAFQIRDDMLGIWGDPRLTGKPLASDIRRKKKSLPVVYVFQQARGRQCAKLEDIYRSTEVGDSEVNKVLAIMDELKAQDYVWQMARCYQQEALADMKALSFSQTDRHLFTEVADFLVERNY